MSNILNKSNHPVQIKRINVRIWKYRDEIEKAIAIRMQECEQQGIELDIEDIKEFYTRKKPKYLDPDYDPEMDEDEAQAADIGADGLDSSGNVMDEEALAMMAAMGGGEGPSEGEESEDNEDEAAQEASEHSEEDDEAARMAAEMLGDQAGESSDAEDEAAKMAAEMLGDQGADEDADALAAAMLADQGAQATTNEPIEQKKLTRVPPDEVKVSYGFALLADLDMREMLVFSKEGYTYGQNICIEFLIPKSFILSAEVKGVSHIGRTSKIISDTKPDYRIQTDFTFLFEGERTNLREFLQSVEPTIPPPPKKIKRTDTEDDDDDEFEDLGF